MNILGTLIVTTSLFVFSSNVYSGWFGGGSFDDCILESMKGVTNNFAARQIRRSCRNKFPVESSTPTSHVVSTKEQSNITGTAGFAPSGYFKGSLYNGNTDIHITEITIVISVSDGKLKDIKEYSTTVYISPKSTSSFSFGAIKGDHKSDFSWNIGSAKGY